MSDTPPGGRHVLVVLSNPVAGREAEYNEWYTNQHLPEVVALPGFVGARRYRLNGAGLDGFDAPAHRYLSAYDIEGSPHAALDALQVASTEGRIVLSPALDLNMLSWCFEQTADYRPGDPASPR